MAITITLTMPDWMTNQSCRRAQDFFAASHGLRAVDSAAGAVSGVGWLLADRSDMAHFHDRRVPRVRCERALIALEKKLWEARPAFVAAWVVVLPLITFRRRVCASLVSAILQTLALAGQGKGYHRPHCAFARDKFTGLVAACAGPTHRHRKNGRPPGVAHACRA